MASTRRLAAILAADMAGYSRLMGADEEATHQSLQAHFHQFVHPKIPEHRGRIVKNTGDGLLAEFASVVDAVRCYAEAIGLYERALALDPRSVEAQSLCVSARAGRVLDGMTASRAVDIERAEALAARALAASPRSPLVRYARGQLL